MPPKYTDEEKERRKAEFDELCPNGPSFNRKGQAICPKCNEGVDLGAVGHPVLYLNHMNTKICLKAQKPKAVTVPTTSTAPAVIKTQEVSDTAMNLPEDQPGRSEIQPLTAKPAPVTLLELDPDGEISLPTALSKLRVYGPKLSASGTSDPNDFLKVFNNLPSSFFSVATPADDVWEQGLNKEMHDAFGWGDELTEVEIKGLKGERVLGFIGLVEYCESKGVELTLFKECARRLVRGIENVTLTHGKKNPGGFPLLIPLKNPEQPTRRVVSASRKYPIRMSAAQGVPALALELRENPSMSTAQTLYTRRLLPTEILR
ncbi:hypothetical protein FA13DRAFT_1718616 [Coprinellus micaceus]|uniref:Uncharacterized protein n=1 Tax=Coprinellus micaceus TaxID=71717 RepID=A0A4Y7SF12_COPMI|nr:hypothetical protein FA13DRAFT_1718616 [Coprinellus micaceus]